MKGGAGGGGGRWGEGEGRLQVRGGGGAGGEKDLCLVSLYIKNYIIKPEDTGGRRAIC